MSQLEVIAPSRESPPEGVSEMTATHIISGIGDADGLTGSVGKCGPAILSGICLGGRLEVSDCKIISDRSSFRPRHFPSQQLLCNIQDSISYTHHG